MTDSRRGSEAHIRANGRTFYGDDDDDDDDDDRKEEQRIAEIREWLGTKSVDFQIMNDLKDYGSEWRKWAKERSVEAHGKVEKKFKDRKELWKKQARLFAQEKLNIQEQEEKKLLQRVKNWTIESPTKANDPASEASAYLEPSLVRVLTLTTAEHPGYFELKKEVPEKYPVNDFLGASGKEILKNKESGTIRHFHLSANNMDWIERFMTNYYPRDAGTSHDKAPKFQPKDVPNVLRREFWHGQQHGSNTDPIHARHMRARLSVIPLERTARDSVKSFAFFMPYLHWEMSKRRARMAVVMKDCARKDRKKKLAPNGFERASDAKRKLLQRAETYRHTTVSDVAKVSNVKRAASELLAGSITNSITDPFTGSVTDSKLPLKQRLGPCGKYLLQVAKVADMMECALDERLLREDLFKESLVLISKTVPIKTGSNDEIIKEKDIFKESPLHPRRTLDQSYYWKLENTERRDKGQVVYRGTSGKFKSRKVVMVDQLWMWILDEDTILTSFPRRWGRNKPDSSGVHKCIRERLKDLQKGDIKSVYDLATLIIDQCSRVFFDRTKPEDERPEVLDIFADAIANVAEESTNAFEKFWGHMLNLDGKDSNKGLDQKAKDNYFSINKEGSLLREAHDIGEELKMMQRVYDQQIHVMKQYKKALENVRYQALSRGPSGHLEIHSGSSGEFIVEKVVVEKNSVENSHEKNEVLKDSITNANDLLEELQSRKWELEDLEKAAKAVSDQLDKLLDLKQQQASALEAKAALERAEESVSQGRTIMVFTIVTIIFAPLGFISSVFGMNNAKFINHPMELSLQLKLMFPISVGVIIISLVIAFSKWWKIPSIIEPKVKPIIKPIVEKYYPLNKQSKPRGLTKEDRDLLYALRNPDVVKDAVQEARESFMESIHHGKPNGKFRALFRKRERGDSDPEV